MCDFCLFCYLVEQLCGIGCDVVFGLVDEGVVDVMVWNGGIDGI